MNDNELRDKLAKEIILKESIICSHNETIHEALESNAITGFKLGWVAARANELRDYESLKGSPFGIRFRVVVGPRHNPRLLFSTTNYESAERYIWAYRGDELELRIDKVWVRE